MLINSYAHDQFDRPGYLVPNPLVPPASTFGTNIITWGGTDTMATYQPTGRLDQQTTGDMLDVCASIRNSSMGYGSYFMFGFTTDANSAVPGWYPGSDNNSWGVQIGIGTNSMALYRQGVYTAGYTLSAVYTDAEVSVRTVADLYTPGFMGLSVKIADPSYGIVEAFTNTTIIPTSTVAATGLRLVAAIVGSGLNSRAYRMLGIDEASIKPAGSFYLG